MTQAHGNDVNLVYPYFDLKQQSHGVFVCWCHDIPGKGNQKKGAPEESEIAYIQKNIIDVINWEAKNIHSFIDVCSEWLFRMTPQG